MTLSLRLLQTHLLSRLPIPDSQVITINPQLPVEEAAEDYAKKLRQVSPPSVAPGRPHPHGSEGAALLVIVTSKNSRQGWQVPPGGGWQMRPHPGQMPLRITLLRGHSPTFGSLRVAQLLTLWERAWVLTSWGQLCPQTLGRSDE